MDQKRASETDLQQRYRILFEHSPRVVYITTRDGRVVDANPAFFRFFGITPDCLDSWNVIESYAHPADRARLLEAVERDGQVEEFMVELRDGAGRIRECAITTTLWRSDDGKLLGYQGIIRDATEEHEMERALRESVERFHLLWRATNDVIYDWNIETSSVTWNDALYTLFRYKPEDVDPTLGWWSAQLHPADSRAVEESLDDTFASDRESWSFEYRFLRGDGTYATVFDRGYIVRAADGRPLRMIGSMVDLTTQKRAEDERRYLEEQLRQSQKMEAIGNLAGGIAHDFNNLLTAVRGHAELLLEAHAGDAELREGLEEITKAANRAASLTRQLLAFSRRQVLQPTVVDINRIVLDMEKMLGRLIGEHITLETKLDPAVSKIVADPSQIEQVIMNLAVNARDAMPDGGRLTIETANSTLTDADHATYSYVTPGSFVLLRVHDTGVGMPKDTLDHAFEPFFTTKPAGKGSGLGLSTVYGIIKQSGGYVWAHSTPGQGSEFRIFLPSMPESSATTEATPAAAAASGSETILIVEDESAVRTLVRRILEKRGFQVVCAENGERALTLAKEHGYGIDLLITDVMMPGMGGREVAQCISEMIPGIRVLYMSGYTEDDVLRQRVEDNTVGFISKPFSADALVEKVRGLLDGVVSP